MKEVMATPFEGTPNTSPARASGIDRRAMLRAGAGGVMVIALPVACGSDAPALGGPAVFGNLSALPDGSMKQVPGLAAFVARDSGGLYAMSSVCTHQGCALPPPASSAALYITCGCHGSQFDRNGAVFRGPAGSPLQHYKVDLAADGTITVQGGMAVDAAARTPVA